MTHVFPRNDASGFRTPAPPVGIWSRSIICRVWLVAPLCLAVAGLAAAIVAVRRALRFDLVRTLVEG